MSILGYSIRVPIVTGLTARFPISSSFAPDLSWVTVPRSPAYSLGLILAISGLFISYVILTGMTTTAIYKARNINYQITKADDQLAQSRIALTEAQHSLDRARAIENGMVGINSVSYVHNGSVVGVAPSL